MLTKSTTTIATILGYEEYIPSSPPKKYHNLTWAGTSEQVAVTFGSVQKVSDAKYEYLGTGSIDGQGNQITKYSKNLYTPCPASNFTPIINSIPNFGLASLTGYCWTGDPGSCPVCNDPPLFKSDTARNSTTDIPSDLLGVIGFNSFTPTTLTNVSSITEVLALKQGGQGGVTNVPLSFVNGVVAPWIKVTANHNYTATLDTEYTDAEALSNALVLTSNGATAENLPRTTGFVTRTTNVVFTLLMSNLIDKQDYLVTVSFRDQNFVTTIRQYGVTAHGTTSSLTDVVPTPIPGGRITVLSPTIVFAP